MSEELDMTAKHAQWPRRLTSAITSSPLADNPLLLAVAGIGFSVSFQTIAAAAKHHGLPGVPWLYPVGIDIGIVALIVEARKLIARRRSDLLPRALAWALSLGTIYINMHGSPAGDWLGRTMHSIMPGLWIVFLELTRWRQKTDIREKEKADPVPLARWLLAPWPTLLLYRRMILQKVYSYSRAVEMDLRRRSDKATLRAHFGSTWRKDAPPDLLWSLRKGIALDEAHARVVLLTQHAPAGPARKTTSGSAGVTSSPARTARAVPGSVPVAGNPPVPGTAATSPVTVPGTPEPVPAEQFPARSGNGSGNGSRERDGSAVPVRRLRDTAELLACAREYNDAWRITHGHNISIDALYERMKPIRRQTVSDLLRQLRAENAPVVASDAQEGAQ